MEFRPLHPDFGAQVIGLDIHHGGTPDEIEVLRQAFDRYGMLLFRGQGRLSGERQVKLASWFGPPYPVDNTGSGDFVSVLKNDETAGSMELPFHSDLTYTDDPIRAICLHAVELPESATSTTFVSGAAAWRGLSDELKKTLSTLTLRHFYAGRIPGFDWPDFSADHPVRLVHPRTGEPILFVTQNHAHRILELDEVASGLLLDALFTALYAPERRYEHVWQQDDTLIWDNLVLQHARTERSDPRHGTRALQRVALSDTTLDEHIRQARLRQVV